MDRLKRKGLTRPDSMADMNSARKLRKAKGGEKLKKFNMRLAKNKVVASRAKRRAYGDQEGTIDNNRKRAMSEAIVAKLKAFKDN